MEESKNTILAKPQNVTDQPNFPNPILLIIEKFQQFFPQLKQEPKKPDVVVSIHSIPSSTTTEGQTTVSKPDTVKFPTSRPVVPPPLKLENEECAQNTTPAVLWQVYALGGFIVLKWAWARWNERKAKNDRSNDEPPSE